MPIKNKTSLTFEDIFKEDGLYRGDNFKDGVCLEVLDGFCYVRSQKSKTDLRPIRQAFTVHRDDFNKLYYKVYNLAQLFK